jgi:hypothetical protein
MLQETDDDDGFDVASVLQHRVELPMNVISLSTDSFMPYDQGIRFEHYVSDPLVLIIYLSIKFVASGASFTCSA